MAVVVDAEVTGLLMMGALSPGLKRHSVSLFEGAAPRQAWCRLWMRSAWMWFTQPCRCALPGIGFLTATTAAQAACTCCAGGRVTGADSIAEMIRELHLSVDAGSGFEGEMARLSSYSRCAGGSCVLIPSCVRVACGTCNDGDDEGASHVRLYRRLIYQWPPYAVHWQGRWKQWQPLAAACPSSSCARRASQVIQAPAAELCVRVK